MTKKVNLMIKAAACAAFLIFSAVVHAQSVPDFAFPRDVETHQTQRLKASLAADRPIDVMQAAMNITVARNQVSADSFNRNVAMFDSLANVLPAPWPCVARLLEASMYQELYSSQPWMFDNRPALPGDWPEDPMAWNREMFADKILGLVDRAIANPDELQGFSLSLVQPLLSVDSIADKAGLTLLDFAAYKAASVLLPFSNYSSGAIIPFFGAKQDVPTTVYAKCRVRRDEIMKNLFDRRVLQGNTPPLAFAVCQYSLTLDNPARLVFLREWSEKLHDKQWGALVLDNLARQYHFNRTSAPERSQLYGWLQDWLAKFGKSSDFAPALKYDLAELAKPTMLVSVPDKLYPGDELKGSAEMANLNRGYLLLYSLPASATPMNTVSRKQFPSKARLVKKLRLDTDGSVPFVDTVAFNFGKLPAGRYAVVPSKTATLSHDWRNEVGEWQIKVINVTDMALITSVNRARQGSGRVYAVDARTQKPLPGVAVTIYGDGPKLKVLKSGRTADDGSFAIPDGNLRIKAVNGNSVVWQWGDTHYYQQAEKPNLNARVLTDLSVYRPGDVVKFAVVAWCRNDHDLKLLAGHPLNVRLRDANRSVLNTLKLTTDAQGRCNGQFNIPASGLLGTFMIDVLDADGNPVIIGSTPVQVAEYKTPGFFVELDPTTQTSDSISFKGLVSTYSGMPLAGVDVDCNIDWQPVWRWWHGSPDMAKFSASAHTGNDGTFTITLPTARVLKEGFDKGVFTITASATSNAGETQGSTPFRFTLGNGYRVTPRMDAKTECCGDTLRFNVPVVDMLGNFVDKEVEYRIVKFDGLDVDSGRFMSPRLDLASASFPSGLYRFTFNCAGDTTSTSCETVIWRRDDVTTPQRSALWLPVTEVVCDAKSDSVSISVGSGFNNSWILCEVSDGNNVLSRQWLISDADMKHVNVAVPSAGNRLWLTFSGMHDFDQEIGTVAVIPAVQLRKLDVQAESLRDKLEAGVTERWKFKFTVDGKPVADIPVMAVMSDKALNAIAPFKWTFDPNRGYWYNRLDLSVSRLVDYRITGDFGKRMRYNVLNTSVPDWETYGYALAGTRRFIRGMAMKSAAGTDGVMVEEAKMNMMATKAESAMVMATADDAMVVEEAMEFDGGDIRESENQEKVRPVSMPSAFFMPMLSAGSDGVAEVVFQTPNLNTTWQFQILGYDSELHTATAVYDATASKTVMVQSNMPRYMRTGDRMQLSALLFNNSETQRDIHAVFKVVDPLTGDVYIDLETNSFSVAPFGSETATIEFDVPGNLSQLSVTAYAVADGFMDGERAFIPVLPATVPVVEARTFYVPSGQDTFTVKVPSLKRDASVSLRYCDNPVWECVTALPSIVTPESKSVYAVATALFGNNMAANVARRFPRVRQALARITADPDSLTSPLQNQSQYKITELQSTPWVLDAQSQKERLMTLNSILDAGALKDANAKLTAELAALQHGSGGWSWCPGMQPSLFMTMKVLRILAMLDNSGALPSDARKLAAIAINYCDNKVYDDYIASGRKFATVPLLNYFRTRQMLGLNKADGNLGRLKTELLKAVIDEWEHFGIADKAEAAMLVHGEKDYKRLANTILESMGQLAVRSADQGWHYDYLNSAGNADLLATARALEAFAAVEPDNEAVDGLRQWLVLQKETRDWGSDAQTAAVTYAILASGVDWTGATGALKIKLGERELELPDGSNLTGSYTVDLDAKEAAKKKLEITRTSTGPAWGGIVSQYVARPGDVKAASVRDLKITKRTAVVVNDSTGVHLVDRPARVGDTLRTFVTITATKPMDYVVVDDCRAACLEPISQLSGYEFKEGISSYVEVRDSKTLWFIDTLPAGTTVLTHDCTVTRRGEYSLGIATVQSQFSPQQTAHSAGNVLQIKSKK